jgi:hypothetical protein
LQAAKYQHVKLPLEGEKISEKKVQLLGVKRRRKKISNLRLVKTGKGKRGIFNSGC